MAYCCHCCYKRIDSLLFKGLTKIDALVSGRGYGINHVTLLIKFLGFCSSVDFFFTSDFSRVLNVVGVYG